jgi:photosystem II stability/assembly factor-like uncharacterized protein
MLSAKFTRALHASTWPRSRRWTALTAATVLAVAGVIIGFVATSAHSTSSNVTPTVSASLAAADVRDAGPIGHGGIWALTGSKVELSSDSGSSWSNVMPAGVDPSLIRAADFLDPAHGWLAVSGPQQRDGTAVLLVYSTDDGGRNWSSQPVDNSTGVADSARVPAHLDFIDPQHGWLEADLASSGAFSFGDLYRTDDGGATWTKLSIPVAGVPTFTSPSDGFLTGGVASDQFYATTDGGASWARVTLSIPSDAPSNEGAISPPVFLNSRVGVLTVTYGSEKSGEVAWDATNDGGVTWTIRHVVQIAAPTDRASPTPTAAIDATHWLAAPAAEHAVIRFDGSSESRASGTGLPQPNLGVISQLTFQPDHSGLAIVSGGVCEGYKTDCSTFNALFRSETDGASWAQLHP